MKFVYAFALSVLIMFAAPLTLAAPAKPVALTKWALDAENSRVNFVTIKKGNIAEIHSFKEVTGEITDGNASITIKADSVDSRVPLRNQRMRELLFETGLFPTIKVTASVADIIDQLPLGQSALVTVPAILSMHNVSKKLDLELRISSLSANILVVASTEPVLIRAADYNMLDGIIKLSSLVENLPIAETVPVNFSLQLKRD